MVKKRQLWLTALFILSVGILSAQEAIKSYWVFHFVPQKDMFYLPYKGNEAELKDLLDVLTANMEHLRSGEIYIHISCYTVSGNAEMSARRMAYLRASRVKSALITKGGITEEMFVTDRLLSRAYGADSLYNVVVVSFPASMEKMEQLAGMDAAAKVRIYNQVINEKIKSAGVEKLVTTEKGGIIPEREAKARCEAIKKERQRVKAIKEENIDIQELLESGTYANGYRFALRANLLRWATFTPDFGLEWRLGYNWGILVNGTWTSWNWKDKDRHYALWEVNPEIRYYMCKKKRGYLGGMYQMGSFSYKLSEIGKQGDLYGVGMTGGYRLELNRVFSLDFSLALGYTHADYWKYRVEGGVRVKNSYQEKNYWGVNHLGVMLVWKLF